MNHNFSKNDLYNAKWSSFVEENKKKSELSEKNIFKNKEKYIETIPGNRFFDGDYSQNYPENSSKNFSKSFDFYTKKNVMEICEESRYDKNSKHSKLISKVKEAEYHDWIYADELNNYIFTENFYNSEEPQKQESLTEDREVSKNSGYFYNEGMLQTVDGELIVSFTSWDNKGSFNFNNDSITFTKAGRYLLNYGLICKDCVNGYTELRINNSPVPGSTVKQLNETGVTNISSILNVLEGDILILILGGTYVVLADKGTSAFMIIEELL